MKMDCGENPFVVILHINTVLALNIDDPFTRSSRTNIVYCVKSIDLYKKYNPKAQANLCSSDVKF